MLTCLLTDLENFLEKHTNLRKQFFLQLSNRLKFAIRFLIYCSSGCLSTPNSFKRYADKLLVCNKHKVVTEKSLFV